MADGHQRRILLGAYAWWLDMRAMQVCGDTPGVLRGGEPVREGGGARKTRCGMNIQPGLGHHVRVNHPGSWYHGEKGVVIGQGSAWGRLIVEIVSTRDGKTYRPEIKRGYLERVQEEGEATA